MRRRSHILSRACLAVAITISGIGAQSQDRTIGGGPLSSVGAPATWLPAWEKSIEGEAKTRYCDRETGEEIGWLVSPFLEGFYNGYNATHDTKWIDRFIDWSDSWIKRGVKEPDGFLGWPKDDGASTGVVAGLFTDNELGDAMALKPAVQLAAVILRTGSLKAKYGDKATSYIALSEQMFAKWDSRGCWRQLKEGGVWVVPMFGIDKANGKWTEGYARRDTDGFTLPDNKQNLIAEWMLAMYDATGKQVYRDRAQKWFKVMRSRMHLRDNDRYFVWNYWDPAGPWDYKADGSTRHWVGVHPNGGYYEVDVRAIVTAYQHSLVFTQADIDMLIKTNRNYMWNRQVAGASFQRIDGGEPKDPWLKTPGVLWTGLLPYDSTLRSVFDASHNPTSWGGLALTPWYVALRSVKLR